MFSSIPMSTMLVGMVLLTMSSQALSSQLYKSVELAWEQHEPGDSIYFDNAVESQFQYAIELALEDNGERIAVTATNVDDNDDFDDKLVLTELYKDFSIGNLDFTIGKKRIDWGVGYAHRPLNFLKPEIRNATGVVVEEGAWIGTAEKFTDSGKVAILAFNNMSQLDSSRKDVSGVGLHLYSLLGDWEVQSLGFYDDQRGGLVGGSVNTVLGDSGTFHSSFLWQQKYNKVTHSADAINFQSNTIADSELSNGFQALFGMTYNFSNNISLLSEYWYDNRGSSNEEWENLFDAGEMQAQIEGLAPLVFAAGQVFNATNLVQHNVLLHARYEGTKFNPVLDMQIAPEDSGVITTGRVKYDWLPTQGVEVGARYFGGASESVYSQLPDQTTFFVRVTGTF